VNLPIGRIEFGPSVPFASCSGPIGPITFSGDLSAKAKPADPLDEPFVHYRKACGCQPVGDALVWVARNGVILVQEGPIGFALRRPEGTPPPQCASCDQPWKEIG
jgi:hypothetical protein